MGVWQETVAEVEALAGSGAAASVAAGDPVGEVGKRAGVAMPLAPWAGDRGKVYARPISGESPSPQGGRSRFSGEPRA
jgi:hypothetical protein